MKSKNCFFFFLILKVFSGVFREFKQLPTQATSVAVNVYGSVILCALLEH